MIQKSKMKGIATGLTLTMMMTMCPTGAFAASGPLETPQEGAAEMTSTSIGGVTYYYADATKVTAEVDEHQYVWMNVPYSDFYGAENIATGQQDDAVDAVTTATTQKFTSDVLAKGTYHNDKSMLGVTVPVQMTKTAYEALQDNKVASKESLAGAPSYSFADADFAGTPFGYKTLTYTDGTYQFSTFRGTEQDASEIQVTEYTCTGSYGDYQITLDGVNTADGVTIGDVSDITIYGVILSADNDGNDTNYALYALNNMWQGTRVPNVELAWSVTGGKELKRGHGSGEKFFEYDMNGKTISTIKLLTSNGIYSIQADLELDEYYTGNDEVTAVVNEEDATKLNITVPQVFENAKVSVSYKEGRTPVSIAENVTPANGTAQLNEAVDLVHHGSHTVTVYSDNYAPVSITLDGITLSYDALDEAIANANELTSGNYTTASWKAMQDALTEAKAVREDATSQDAVDEATKNLKDAITALKKVSYSGGGGGSVYAGPSTTTQTDNAIANAIVLKVGDSKADVYGSAKKLDATPIIIGDRTMVPIRFVAENLGCKVDWIADKQQVIITKADGTVLTMIIDQVPEDFDAAPIIMNNRTMVPIRYISEKMGYQVDWNSNTQTITIKKTAK